MSATLFAIAREDGRSNVQVVLDVVKGREPGRVFTYEELAAELQQGTQRKFDRTAVTGVVRQSGARLSKEQQRALQNLRGVGYRLAHANDHRTLAHSRHRRSEAQLRRGLTVLKHVRWDEMDPNIRQAHLGMLMITEAVCANVAALTKRQSAVEGAIARLIQRVDSIEGSS